MVAVAVSKGGEAGVGDFGILPTGVEVKVLLDDGAPIDATTDFMASRLVDFVVVVFAPVEEGLEGRGSRVGIGAGALDVEQRGAVVLDVGAVIVDVFCAGDDLQNTTLLGAGRQPVLLFLEGLKGSLAGFVISDERCFKGEGITVDVLKVFGGGVEGPLEL